MWNDIHPSEEWIDCNLPEVFRFLSVSKFGTIPHLF